MLDRFLNRIAKWSPLRLWTYLILLFFIVAEVTSLIGGPISSCIVNASDYGEYYAQNNKCPALHVFFIKSFASIFETIGHEWLTAIATAVIAVFTIVLVIVTNRQARLTLAAVELARNEFISSHRPRMRVKRIWLTHDTDWRVGGPFEVEKLTLLMSETLTVTLLGSTMNPSCSPLGIGCHNASLMTKCHSDQKCELLDFA